MDQYAIEQPQPAKSVWELFCLTACFFGIDLVHAMEQALMADYLGDLSIPPAVMPFVMMAGPLSRLVLEPYIGMRSDHCRSRFGRRSPFMIFGAIASIVSLMLLAWTPMITWKVAKVLHHFGIDIDVTTNQIIVMSLTVFMLHMLDLCLNLLQAAAHALIVDTAPALQSNFANAWASRVGGVGNIAGFALAYVKFTRYLALIGDTQIKDLAVPASIALLLSVGFTAVTISDTSRSTSQPHEISDEDGERASIRSSGSGESIWSGKSLFAALKEWWFVMTRLPKAIKQVCLVQVAAWVAWYPILIFTTTWIRDLCELERRSPEEGLRKGSLGMLCEAGVSLICSTVFPWLVRKSPILTLKHMWLASNIILAILSLLAFVVDDVTSAIVLTACVGVPWSIASWVPFAIIAAEMKKAQVEDDAGMVMGIHDMAINLAQAITVGTNSIIFQLVSRPDGELRGDDRAWVFLFGGYAAIVAACLTWRIEEESTKND